MNLGAALTAAVGYRIFVDQKAEVTTRPWLVGTAILTGSGQSVLTLLDGEE